MTQQQALTILQSGKNVFLTGPAGSGKTYLLNKYIEWCEERGKMVGITASTGIAATHIQGTTIHSFTGIGIRDFLYDGQIRGLTYKQHLVSNFAFLNVLVIDEISMLASHTLDLVNRVCQEFKNSAKPFGGVQVVLCGDFFQLPPVNRNPKYNQFAYTAKSWMYADFQICYLEEQHRQDDPVFLKVLNDIRHSEVTPDTHKVVSSRMNVSSKNDVPPTKLYTHNMDVDAINERSLNWLPGQEYKYEMEMKLEHMFDIEGEKKLRTAMKNCMAPEKLLLKEGAIVMFVKNNWEDGYVNGTLGKVIGFVDGYPKVLTREGKEIVAVPQTWEIKDAAPDEKGKEALVGSFTQVPLRLAWAITVHKSQGMSLDAAIIDLSKAFEPGMGYVALSRLRTLEGLYLIGLNDTAFVVHSDVEKQDRIFRNQAKSIERELLKSEYHTGMTEFIF